jgi:hypothetical protein
VHPNQHRLDVGRSAPDDGLSTGVRHGFQLAPQRLRSGGRRRPGIVALVVVAVLVVLAWRPWASDQVAVGPSPGSPAPAIAGFEGLAVPTPATGGPDGPAPSPAIPAIDSPPASYTAIIEDQWTVVALVSPYTPVSSEEPATQHNREPAWSTIGPFLMLQQGLIPVDEPIEQAADPGALCQPTGVARDRNAVPLPAGRVAYVGITVPKTLTRAPVTAAILGGPPGTIALAAAPTVQLAGMDGGRRYVIPSSGPGGAILFGPTTPGPLPAGVYRFEVAGDASVGTSYLYACVTTAGP